MQTETDEHAHLRPAVFPLDLLRWIELCGDTLPSAGPGQYCTDCSAFSPLECHFGRGAPFLKSAIVVCIATAGSCSQGTSHIILYPPPLIGILSKLDTSW